MNPDLSVNVWAVLGAAALNMVIGSLWYGPLFGKQWMAAMGWTPERMKDPEQKKKGQKAMMWMVLTSLITAYVLTLFVYNLSAATWGEGAMLGFWLWLGFQITLVLEGMIFEGKKKELVFINGGYHLAALCAMGALLAIWA